MREFCECFITNLGIGVCEGDRLQVGLQVQGCGMRVVKKRKKSDRL